MFSRVLCGEGIPTFYTPEWADLDHECPSSFTGMLAWALGECKSLEKYNIPKAKDGWPEPTECTKRNFLKLYTAPEVASAFEYFWNNGDGI
mgnify:CR=1 FL=1